MTSDASKLLYEQRAMQCESPAERALLAGMISLIGEALEGLDQQFRVAEYRLDFAIPGLKLGIEVDGFTFHGRTPEQFERDRVRDRRLFLLGWAVLRFSAHEVFKDPLGCASQVASLVCKRNDDLVQAGR